MNTCLIDPLAPLIIRSGRPFDGQAGSDEARFPPPSTLAGALRTAHAEAGSLAFSPALQSIQVMGPLPARLGKNGKPGLLVPKPANALYFANALARAEPLKLGEGEGMDLPGDLLPVQMASSDAPGKPVKGPSWWAWEDMEAFRQGKTLDFKGVESRGWTPPEDDVRTHVAINAKTGAAEGGKLFQTAGLTFLPSTEKGSYPEDRIVLIGGMAERIPKGLMTLGGERRLSAIQPASGDIWPKMPDGILKAKGLCLTLLTPALFAQGWRPGWLDADLTGTPPGCDGLKLRLRAASLDRWQPHSGWDLASQQPRAGRKLTPAGATYWFEVLESSEAALKALWLASVCDLEQDQRDGFGLAVMHAWTP